MDRFICYISSFQWSEAVCFVQFSSQIVDVLVYKYMSIGSFMHVIFTVCVDSSEKQACPLKCSRFNQRIVQFLALVLLKSEHRILSPLSLSLGLFYFLGSIVNFSQDSDVHFKYIQVSMQV